MMESPANPGRFRTEIIYGVDVIVIYVVKKPIMSGTNVSVKYAEKEEMKIIYGMDAGVKYVANRKMKIIYGMDANV
jgi:hypothetical protein